MHRHLIAALAATALALVFSSAALASSSFVPDPDEPGVPADRDIESVVIDQPTTALSPWVRIAVKFRAPYSHTPFIYIKTNRTYKIYNNLIHGGGPTEALITTQTPAAAPDTIAYSFNLSRIGNPASFQWIVTNSGGDDHDRAPDAGWQVHSLGPQLPGPVFP
jgi:hypothetical protein